jgi:hypothetical protein
MPNNRWSGNAGRSRATISTRTAQKTRIYITESTFSTKQLENKIPAPPLEPSNATCPITFTAHSFFYYYGAYDSRPQNYGKAIFSTPNYLSKLLPLRPSGPIGTSFIEAKVWKRSIERYG